MKRIHLFFLLSALLAGALAVAVRSAALGAGPSPPERGSADEAPPDGGRNEQSGTATGKGTEEEKEEVEDGEGHGQGEGVDASERDLMIRLRDLARQDPKRALRLADEGESRFAGGEHREERQAIAINLLVRLGRMGEARARTRVFISRYPRGKFTRRVRGLTGVHPRPAGPNRELEW
jgi:hypothetical protein